MGKKAVVAPPFAQAQAAPAAAPADPFAAVAQAPTAQSVHLVIDDKTTISDAEAGKKKAAKNYILIAVGLVLGLGGGYMFGSTIGENELYDLAVGDGAAIYTSVQGASTTVTQAKRHIDAAVTAARGAPGTAASVDYASIEALRALENPFTAGEFSRRRYKAFNPATVDSLFQYYSNVNTLWSRFEAIDALTQGEQRREQLDAAAAAAAEIATQTGCVPSLVENRLLCRMVYVAPPEVVEGQPPPSTVKVRSRFAGRRTFDKEIYVGQDLSENPDNYVILTDTRASMDVLGSRASHFAAYSAQLLAIKALLDETMEIQGQLETGIGEVARLQ